MPESGGLDSRTCAKRIITKVRLGNDNSVEHDRYKGGNV